MSSPSKTDAAQQVAMSLDCEALLRAEIVFWQEMITTCPATQPGESLERMRQALALAEAKLAMLGRPAGTGGFPGIRKY